MKFITAFNVAFLSVLDFPTRFTLAMPHARERIPNGFKVPNPDIPGSIWSGVGHQAVGGGGVLNPFGRDFKEAGFQWTVDLCRTDSDGDGRTNGQELGDPDCTWNQGEEPTLPATSHPGIPDEPTDIPPANTCTNFEPPDNTKTMDITFTQPNNLDGTRTQYVCEQFEALAPTMNPWTNEFQQIKTEPLIDNQDVIHHIWIYICDGVDSSDGFKVGEGSYGCSGVEGNCQIIAGWAVGGEAFCEPENVGAAVSFSPTSASAVFKVEAHYDNPYGRMTTDKSGMRLHLVGNDDLRPLYSGQVILGMDYWDRQFELEQSQNLVARSNICPTEATMQLPHPVWIYTWNPHMHLYGKRLVTEHYRCGEKIGEIGNIQRFEFNNQQSYVLDPPVKILPGDALVTTCYFDTSDAMNAISGGEETTEEMCDNYLTYYPTVWTPEQPNLFTACNAFEAGLRPELAGYDDTTPFVTLDLAGEIFISNRHSADPTQNLAPCCYNGGAARCERKYRSWSGEACAVDSDCRGQRTCVDRICGFY